MKLDALYKEVIMEHYRTPHGRAPLANVDKSAHGYNSSCGDDYQVNLQLDGDRISGVQIEGHGCAISGAAASMISEVLVGMTADEFKSTLNGFRDMLKTGTAKGELPGDLEALVGVSQFPVRVKCASLPLTTVLSALTNH